MWGRGAWKGFCTASTGQRAGTTDLAVLNLKQNVGAVLVAKAGVGCPVGGRWLREIMCGGPHTMPDPDVCYNPRGDGGQEEGEAI